MQFKRYEDIPAKLRRVILEETGVKRVKRVSLALCNEILEDYFAYEQENEKLKEFELHLQKSGGSVIVKKFQDYKSAAVALDREIDYIIGSRGVTAVITQAGRPVRGYENGRVLTTRSIYG